MSSATMNISFEDIKSSVHALIRSRMLGPAAPFTGAWMAAGPHPDGLIYATDQAAITLLPQLELALRDGRPVLDVHREHAPALTARCQQIVDRWDVRNATRLIDLFPEAVPETAHLRPAKCSIGPSGQWSVNFDLSRRREQSARPSGKDELALNFLVGSGGRLAGMLPDIHRAQSEFNAAWDRATLGGMTGMEASAMLRSAVRSFNQVLAHAAEAFYLDTSSYNSWHAIRHAYGPDRNGSDDMTLWFVNGHEAGEVAEMLDTWARDLETAKFEKRTQAQLQLETDSQQEHEESSRVRLRN